MAVSFYLILGIILWIIFAFWPAILARRKGYSFILFFLIALFISWLLALVIILVLKDKNQTPESLAADRAAEAELDKEENAR